MSHSQICVQSCHACFEAGKSLSSEEHPHFVICGVEKESSLNKVIDLLKENNIPFVTFHEADINNELTAVAAGPVRSEQRKIFRKFQLLKL